MKKAKKLQYVERIELKILLNKGYSIRSIASVLDRSHGTISDEINNLAASCTLTPLRSVSARYSFIRVLG
jgi:IS30 family transposase